MTSKNRKCLTINEVYSHTTGRFIKPGTEGKIVTQRKLNEHPTEVLVKFKGFSCLRSLRLNEVKIMLSICKTFEFEAAHYLPDYDGPCANLHGHSYKLEIEVSGTPVKGMIIDFSNLKNIVKKNIIKKLDHRVINDELEINPTAENMVCWIERMLFFSFEDKQRFLKIVRIRLWETSTSWAEWKANEF